MFPFKTQSKLSHMSDCANKGDEISDYMSRIVLPYKYNANQIIIRTEHLDYFVILNVWGYRYKYVYVYIPYTYITYLRLELIIHSINVHLVDTFLKLLVRSPMALTHYAVLHACHYVINFKNVTAAFLFNCFLLLTEVSME